MPESLPQRERLEAVLNLSSQWKQEAIALNESGVLEILPDSRDLGIAGVNGQENILSLESKLCWAASQSAMLTWNQRSTRDSPNCF